MHPVVTCTTLHHLTVIVTVLIALEADGAVVTLRVTESKGEGGRQKVTGYLQVRAPYPHHRGIYPGHRAIWKLILAIEPLT